MNEIKLFIVSSDVFDRYIRRDECMESYMWTPCSGKFRESVFDHLNVLLGEDYFNGEISRYYIDFATVDEDFILKRNYPLNFSSFCYRTVLVEDFRLPKLSAYHYKDYIFKVCQNS